MIRLDGFFGLQIASDNGSHQTDQIDGSLRKVNLSSEQSYAGAGLFCPGNQLEGVARCALGSTEDADDQTRGVVRRQGFHAATAVVHELEKYGLFGGNDARQNTDDRIADEVTHLLRRNTDVEYGVKDFKKMARAQSGRLGAEFRIRLQRHQIPVDLVGKSHRVKPQIGEFTDS